MKYLSNLPEVSQASKWQGAESQFKLKISLILEPVSFPLHCVAFWSEQSGRSSPAWSLTVSARIAGVHWCEGPSEREDVVSASHLLHSSRGQKCAHERKENYTYTRPPVVAREGFRERGAPDIEYRKAERWDGNSTRQRVWRPRFQPWLCHLHPVGRGASPLTPSRK